jgi:hypothetical protein
LYDLSMTKFESVSDADFNDYLKNGPGMTSVPMPDSIPTGSRHGKSTEGHAMGVPPPPSPSWAEGAAEHRRLRLAGLSAPDEIA